MPKEKELKMQVVEPSLVMPMALAEVFIKSGMFKDVKTQAEAIVKILAGRELGLAPIQSMNEVFIVNGKTSVTAKIIAGLLVKSGRYSYHVDSIDDKQCTITFFDILPDKTLRESGKSTFTFQDAAKAGLVNKDVWKNYPRNMLFSRALSNGQRWYAPDIFYGYIPEELENIPTESVETTIEFDQQGNQVQLEENNGKA